MRRALSGIFALSLFFISLFVYAQPQILNEVPKNSGQFTAVGNKLFFVSGDSLFKSNGTVGGVSFVKAGFKTPNNLFAFNGSLYFLNDGNKEMWRSDGTTAGTFLVNRSDLNQIDTLNKNGNYLYFTSENSSSGRELYRTNGTQAGTLLLKDINPGSNNSSPIGGGFLGSIFYFSADDGSHGNELWKTDGTAAGTAMVKDINPGIFSGISSELLQGQSLIYFAANDGVHGTELWKTDGTVNGTALVKDITLGPSSSSIDFIRTNYNDLYFLTDSIYPGGEQYDYFYDLTLWKSNGTDIDTDTLHKWVNLESEYSYYAGPDFFFNGKLYFFFRDGGIEMWATDGTPQGTNFIKDVGEFYEGGIGDPIFLNNKFIFYGTDDGYYSPMFKSDGTANGTVRLYYINAAFYTLGPRQGPTIGNNFYFADHTSGDGGGFGPGVPEDYYQLIQTDGNIVKPIRDIFGVSLVGTNNIININNKLYFTTYDDQSGGKGPKLLWAYDPTKPTTPGAYFTLVDADKDVDLQWLKNGDKITKFSNQNITIRYNPIGTVGSVQFKLNDVVRRTDNFTPYALAGDINGNYSPWLEAKPGNYKLTTTPYSSSNASGTAGTPLTINFTILDELTPHLPTANAGPDVDVILPKDRVVLTGIATDSNGYIINSFWGIISGPNEPEFLNNSNNSTTVIAKGLIEGIYAFRFTAIDNDGNTVFDDVQVTVKKVAGLSVVSYSLINADTDTEIKVLSNGETTIDLSTLPTQNLNIKVNLNGTASKVTTKFDNLTARTESVAPYSFFGDNNGNYNGVKIAAGSHTLLATPYTTSNAVGTPLTITISVINGNTNQLPIVNAGIDKTVVLPTTTVTLSGSASDPDGTITGLQWTKTQGANVTMTGATSANLQVSGLAEGTYTFRLTATDNKGGQGYDEATVTVVKAGQSVVSFTLINADTDQDIKMVNNNDVINISQLPTSHLNIRVNTNPATVGSVKLVYDGGTRTENAAPYSLFGDNNGNFNVGLLTNGSHTFTATPYSSSNGGGTVGNAMTINFTVTNSSAKIAASAPIIPVGSIKMYPNPSPSQFAIEIVEPGEEWIVVEILDMHGHLVETLFEGNASTHLNLIWDGSQHEGGMYICRIKSNEKIHNEKLYVVK